MLSGIGNYIKNFFSAWKIRIIIILLFGLLLYTTYKQMQFYAIFCLLLLLYFFAPELIRKIILFVSEHFERLPGGTIPRKPPDFVTSVTEDTDREQTNREEMDTDSEGANDAVKSFEIGNILLRNGSNSEAIEYYNNAIEKKHDYKDAFLNLGAAYMALWNEKPKSEYLKKSIDASKKVLILDPDGYRSRINLAVALSKDYETEEEALKLYEEADKKGDLKDPFTWGKVKLFKGQLYYNKSLRDEKSPDINLLRKAEINVEESIKLFRMGGNELLNRLWIYEARELLSFIQKRIKLNNRLSL